MVTPTTTTNIGAVEKRFYRSIATDKTHTHTHTQCQSDGEITRSWWSAATKCHWFPHTKSLSKVCAPTRFTRVSKIVSKLDKDEWIVVVGLMMMMMKEFRAVSVRMSAENRRTMFVCVCV